MEGALPLLGPLFRAERVFLHENGENKPLVSIDHRADDNGFPSLSAVQVSRRIQHRRILHNFVNRAKLERRVSNGYRFWAMWRKVGKESWERRLVIGR